MLGKRLSESMSDIGDDLIADAMEYRAEKKRNVWLRVAAVAAVVAMVIGLTAVLWDGTEPGEQMGMPTVGTTVAPTQLPTTLPDVPTVPTESQGYELVKVSGVLKVYACDKENVSEEELKKYELTDTIDSYKTMIVPYTNFGGAAIPFVFSFPSNYFNNDDLKIEITTEYGHFYTTKDGKVDLHAQKISIKNNEKIYWTHGSVDDAIVVYGDEGRFYADIIIWIENRIVGYGVVDFVFYNPDVVGARPSFVTTGFTTMCFPMIDGKYQNVTEEDVWKEIEAYKQMKAELEEV